MTGRLDQRSRPLSSRGITRVPSGYLSPGIIRVPFGHLATAGRPPRLPPGGAAMDHELAEEAGVQRAPRHKAHRPDEDGHARERPPVPPGEGARERQEPEPQECLAGTVPFRPRAPAPFPGPCGGAIAEQPVNKECGAQEGHEGGCQEGNLLQSHTPLQSKNGARVARTGSGAGVRLTVDRAQPLHAGVGVDLRRLDGGVAQQLLDRS